MLYSMAPLLQIDGPFRAFDSSFSPAHIHIKSSIALRQQASLLWQYSMGMVSTILLHSACMPVHQQLTADHKNYSSPQSQCHTDGITMNKSMLAYKVTVYLKIIAQATYQQLATCCCNQCGIRRKEPFSNQQADQVRD